MVTFTVYLNFMLTFFARPSYPLFHEDWK